MSSERHDLLAQALSAIEKLEAKLQAAERNRTAPIAIVGMGCRYPAAVSNPDEFWDALAAGRDAVVEIPPARWSRSALKTNHPGARFAALLDRIDSFDAPFFGIAGREAVALDPQQRLLLEVTWESLEHAGIVPGALKGSDTGVFIGICSGDYQHQLNGGARAPLDAYAVTGNMMSTAAGRLSYVFGFQGPCMALDTACSSSLVAIHLACHSLHSRESRMAIAGGVSLILSPRTMEGLAETQALSPDGRSRAFDAGANGFVRGEGCGIVVLKRLEDALADGDRIWACIRGSAVNQDGRSTGLTTPNVLAQQELLKRALANAQVSPDEIDYIEAHGTGTVLGDPIEFDALREVFGGPRNDGAVCSLGSVKTNIGHLEGAAGVAGLMKVVMAFEREQIPRHLHFRTLNPHIALDGTPFVIPTEPIAWPRSDRRRIAGVSSFGMSGTNAHLVLEEAPADNSARTSMQRRSDLDATAPLLVSGRDMAALRAQAERWAAWIEAHPEVPWGGVIESAARRRTHFTARTALLVDDHATASAGLRAVAAGQPHSAVVIGHARGGRVAVLFTGQGSQRVAMARGLYESDPVFRAAVDEIAGELDVHLDRPLLDVLFAADEEEASQIHQTAYAQPALFAVEVALFRRWQAWGLRPDRLLGHSVGELAAAHVAGVLPLADAAKLVAARGRLMQLCPTGAMVAVPLGETDVRELVAPYRDRVDIAAINGPEQTVISGDEEAVLAIASRVAAMGRRPKRLTVSHAFHSPHMDAMLAAFGEVARTCTFEAPKIPVISNLTGAPAGDRIASAEYWVEHARRPVRFLDGLRSLAADNVTTFLECGPEGVLCALGPGALPEGTATFVPSLKRSEDSLLRAMAQLHVAGVELDWDRILARSAGVADLPTYAFQRARYWLEPAEGEFHPLLGEKCTVAESDLTLYSTTIAHAAPAWVADHRVLGRTLLPGAAFLEIMLAAGHERYEEATCALRDVAVVAPLALGPQDEARLQITVKDTEPGRSTVRIYSRSGGTEASAWMLHAEGVVVTSNAVPPSGAEHLPPAGARAVDVSGMYAAFETAGVAYGPSFRGVVEAWRSGEEVWARIGLPHDVVRTASRYRLHPALLDAAFHVAALADGAQHDKVQVPAGVAGIDVWQPGASSVWVCMTSALQPSFTLFDGQGQPVAHVDRLRLASADGAFGRSQLHDVRYRFAVRWQPAGPARIPLGGRWGVWCSDAAARHAGAIVAALEGAGATSVISAPFDSALIDVDGVVCAWDESPSPRAAHEAAARALALLQSTSAKPRPQLVWLTRQAIGTSASDDVSGLAASPLWGLARTARLEDPDRRLMCIDFGAEADLSTLAAALTLEGEQDCAIRGGELLVPRLHRASDGRVRSSRPEHLELRTSGTVLITGGLGALGRHVARWLVTGQRAPAVLLASRRGPATDGADAFAAELRELGAEASVVACDVADQRALAALVNSHPIRAVVHAAGTIDDGLLSALSRERMTPVLAPKIDGAWNLHQLTRGLDLDFFVLFSSVTGTTGSAGQGNYAAAAVFLDSLAHHRRALGLPATSIAWGPWAGGGMATAAGDAVEARLRQQGVTPLTPGQGVALLNAAVARDDITSISIAFEPGHFQRALEKRGLPLPPLYRSLLTPRSAPPRESSEGSAPAGLRDRIAAALESEREAILRRVLIEEIASVLGIAAGEVAPDRAISEMGADSLMAMDIRNRLAAGSGLDLPATLVFDHPNVGALARYLLERWNLDTRARPMVSSTGLPSRNREPIAIVGIACRLPAADGPAAFWRVIRDGIDAITEIPVDRWNRKPANAPDKMATMRGGFLEGLDRFDAHFFGITPREAPQVDPQQRLLLEVAWEAVEDAGIPVDRLAGSRTGVFVGIASHDYTTLDRSPADVNAYTGTGLSGAIAANRISYVFDLRGPSVVVDTACSASLAAVHLACQSLWNGEAGLALVGGAHALLAPEDGLIGLSKAGAMAADGRCKTFDARADGYVRSEGAGMVVLKPLERARADGDRVYATILSAAINADGRTNGLMAPNRWAQEEVIREAWRRADVSPALAQYVEAHGTGTPLGDPIEAAALGAVVGADRPDGQCCIVGSVKANIGHLEAAAGIAGLIKATLILTHRVVPPSVHFEQPNPHIPFAELRLRVARTLEPWPDGDRPLVGVSSFGFGGANAHVVLEGVAERQEPAAIAAPPARAELLPISTRSDAALHALVHAYAEFIDAADAALSLRSICYTAGARRTHHDHRAAYVARSKDDLRAQIVGGLAASRPGAQPAALRRTAGKIAFMFPGQGSQWSGMGRTLLRDEPVFRSAIVRCERAFAPFVDWSLTSVIEDPAAGVDAIDVVQPTLFAMQVAIAELWRSWGIEPAAVVGHSMGEVAAAHIAGVLTLEHAAQIICRRSAILKRKSGRGAMAVTELSLQAANEVLRPYDGRIAIAAANGPRSTVVSGDEAAVVALLGGLEQQGIFARRVNVDVASHSPQMDDLGEPLFAALAGIDPADADGVAFYSTVAGRRQGGSACDAQYWVHNLRDPVLFAPAVEQLLADEHDCFLEVSPHPLLLAAVEDTCRHVGSPALVVASLRRGEDERASLLGSLAELYVAGHSVDWAAVSGEAGLADLPRYPWQRERFWISSDPDISSHDRETAADDRHPMLRSRFDPSSQPDTSCWGADFSLDRLSFLRDHEVEGTVVLPATAYIELALAAAGDGRPFTPCVIEGATFERLLAIDPQEPREMQVTLTRTDGAVRIASRRAATSEGVEWTRHAAMTVRREPDPPAVTRVDLDAIRAR